jgi:hypothetical protein
MVVPPSPEAKPRRGPIPPLTRRVRERPTAHVAGQVAAEHGRNVQEPAVSVVGELSLKAAYGTPDRSPCRTTARSSAADRPTLTAVAANAPFGAVLKSSLLTLVLGVLLVGAYFLLKAFDVVGQPTDIGGGLILLAGYVVTAVGAVLVGRDLLRYRSSRR